MMVSQNALHHAEKCRFCFMCRHLCPVQLQTGREIDTPRARGLLLSIIQRGTAQFDEGAARAMYECFLCDACVNDCATGYQPPVFIREARTEAVVNGLAPEPVKRLIENVERTGNIYGVEKPSFARKGSDVLVYLGEAAACRAPDMARGLLRLLERSGVSAEVLDEEPPSGAMLADLAGYVDETVQQARRCADAIRAAGRKTVVVLDSYDAEIMKQRYPQWGCEIGAEVVTATSYAASLLADGRLQPAAPLGLTAACHDDDRLARTFHEFEPVRAMARAAGYEVTEMFRNRLLARSCGSAAALEYMPEIVTGAAAARWDDLARTGARVMLTASPQAWLCLSRAIPEGMELTDLFTALAGGPAPAGARG